MTRRSKVLDRSKQGNGVRLSGPGDGRRFVLRGQVFRSLLEAAVLLCEKFTGRLHMLRDIGL